jgi:hypothetical protein
MPAAFSSAHIPLDATRLCGNVAGLQLGVMGAAMATSIAQWVSFATLLGMLIKGGRVRVPDLMRPPPLAEVLPLLRSGMLLSGRTIVSFGAPRSCPRRRGPPCGEQGCLYAAAAARSLLLLVPCPPCGAVGCWAVQPPLRCHVAVLCSHGRSRPASQCSGPRNGAVRAAAGAALHAAACTARPSCSCHSCRGRGP